MPQVIYLGTELRVTLGIVVDPNLPARPVVIALPIRDEAGNVTEPIPFTREGFLEMYRKADEARNQLQAQLNQAAIPPVLEAVDASDAPPAATNGRARRKGRRSAVDEGSTSAVGGPPEPIH